VIAGWDPTTRSMVATSGNVSASVGPNGPLIIIDEEAVVPVQPGQPGTVPVQPGQPVPQPTAVPNPSPDGGAPVGPLS